jgi:hypothetical protein
MLCASHFIHSNTERGYAECHYAQCRGAVLRGLNVKSVFETHRVDGVVETFPGLCIHLFDLFPRFSEDFVTENSELVLVNPSMNNATLGLKKGGQS